MPANAKHPEFRQPTDPSIQVWRYLDLPRYLSILCTKSLWFAQIAQLSDSHEGSATRQEIDNEQLALSLLGDEVCGFSASGYSVLTHNRAVTYANCWCASTSESDALWRIYGNSSQGLAIKTTFGRLAQAILDDDIYIGCVQYMDYECEAIESDNLFAYVMHKRSVFEYEREVRLVKYLSLAEDGTDARKHHGPVRGASLNAYPAGIAVKVDIELLAPEVVISPYADDWFIDLVSEMSVRLGSKYPVRWSSMRTQPYLPRRPWTKQSIERARQMLFGPKI